MSKSRILVVDDEPDLVWSVRHTLGDEGYEVLTAYDGLEGLTLARHQRPDLVILDIVMPRLDGLQLCRRLRRDPSLAAVPVLFLTARGSTEDLVKEVDEGGDDLMGKPFDVRELKARVKALLRRRCATQGQPQAKGCSSPLVCGPLSLNSRGRQLRVNSKTVQLTPSEFKLLYHLMTHCDEVFSSEELLQDVFNYPPGTADPSLVRWHIKNLRQKIEPNTAHPVYIRTIPYQGYMLVRDE